MPVGDPSDSGRGARADQVLDIGVRIANRPAQSMVEAAFAGELEAERALAPEMGLADLAHTIMSIEAGIVPAAPGRTLLRALLELHDQPRLLALDPRLGDLYTNREAWLADRTEAAGWLGAGRARREATTVAYQLLVRGRLLDLAPALVGLADSLTGRALDLRGALSPDYTYLRAGQPTSFGHTLLATAFGVLRDLERLRALYQRWDHCAAGCGSANGSRLPQDRPRLAALLGFGGVAEHARDAMWQADLAVEALGVAVAAAVNADRLAEDLWFYAADEVGLVVISDAHARASKIMPQKQNPYALAYVRAVAHRVLGAQAAVSSAGRTPSGQPDSRIVAYRAVPEAIQAVSGAVGILGEVVADLEADAARGEALLASGFTWATDLAEALSREAGLDFRTAHRAVGTLVRELVSGHGGSVTAERVAEVAGRIAGRPAPISRDAVERALDPRRAVAERTGPGGAAPQEVEAMAARCRAALGEHRAWVDETGRRVREGAEALLARARALAAGG